jgi:hypothetical protein
MLPREQQRHTQQRGGLKKNTGLHHFVGLNTGLIG